MDWTTAPNDPDFDPDIIGAATDLLDDLWIAEQERLDEAEFVFRYIQRAA